MPQLNPFQNAAHNSECNGCPVLTRRQFVGRASFILAGLALVGCEVGSPLRPLGSALSINVADFPALLSIGGAVRIMTDPKTPIALARTDIDQFEAFSLKCPHEGHVVNVNGGATPFGCPNHGAQFDVTGKWVGGQKTGNLTRYRTTFDESSGTITISPN